MKNATLPLMNRDVDYRTCVLVLPASLKRCCGSSIDIDSIASVEIPGKVYNLPTPSYELWDYGREPVVDDDGRLHDPGTLVFGFAQDRDYSFRAVLTRSPAG